MNSQIFLFALLAMLASTSARNLWSAETIPEFPQLSEPTTTTPSPLSSEQQDGSGQQTPPSSPEMTDTSELAMHGPFTYPHPHPHIGSHPFPGFPHPHPFPVFPHPFIGHPFPEFPQPNQPTTTPPSPPSSQQDGSGQQNPPPSPDMFDTSDLAMHWPAPHPHLHIGGHPFPGFQHPHFGSHPFPVFPHPYVGHPFPVFPQPNQQTTTPPSPSPPSSQQDGSGQQNPPPSPDMLDTSDLAMHWPSPYVHPHIGGHPFPGFQHPHFGGHPFPVFPHPNIGHPFPVFPQPDQPTTTPPSPPSSEQDGSGQQNPPPSPDMLDTSDLAMHWPSPYEHPHIGGHPFPGFSHPHIGGHPFPVFPHPYIGHPFPVFPQPSQPTTTPPSPHHLNKTAAVSKHQHQHHQALN